MIRALKDRVSRQSLKMWGSLASVLVSAVLPSLGWTATREPQMQEIEIFRGPHSTQPMSPDGLIVKCKIPVNVLCSDGKDGESPSYGVHIDPGSTNDKGLASLTVKLPLGGKDSPATCWAQEQAPFQNVPYPGVPRFLAKPFALKTNCVKRNGSSGPWTFSVPAGPTQVDISVSDSVVPGGRTSKDGNNSKSAPAQPTQFVSLEFKAANSVSIPFSHRITMVESSGEALPQVDHQTQAWFGGKMGRARQQFNGIEKLVITGQPSSVLQAFYYLAFDSPWDGAALDPDKGERIPWAWCAEFNRLYRENQARFGIPRYPCHWGLVSEWAKFQDFAKASSPPLEIDFSKNTYSQLKSAMIDWINQFPRTPDDNTLSAAWGLLTFLPSLGPGKLKPEIKEMALAALRVAAQKILEDSTTSSANQPKYDGTQFWLAIGAGSWLGRFDGKALLQFKSDFPKITAEQWRDFLWI